MITATLITIMILSWGCVWVVWKYFKAHPAKRHPKVAEENHYDRDYCNLLNAIPKAKNLRELEMARKRVAHFRRQYKDGRNGASVENDVCELNRHIEQVKVVLEMHPSIQLN